MDTTRAKEILDKFAGKKIVVIGDIMLDRYIYGRVERLNPEAPVPILEAKKEKCVTGGAGNTAKNAAKLGASAVCVSVIGNDGAAEKLAKIAANEGYQTKLVEDKDRPTIEKNRYIVNTQQMLRVDYEERREVPGEIEEKLINAIREALQGAAGVVVSDYAKGVITERVSESIMAEVKKSGIPLMADVKPSHINYFTGATYISPNRKEAHEFLGFNQHDNCGRDAADLAKLLRETFQTNVFLTLGADGIYVLGEGEAGEQVPQKYVAADEVLDTSGCGDTVAATVLLAKLAGATNVEAADLANAAAAAAAHKIGAAAVSPQEVLEILENHLSKVVGSRL